MAHPDNRLYGHGQALADHAGFDGTPAVLRAHVQHGWVEAEGATGLSAADRLVGWLPKRVWSTSNLRACRAQGVEPVEAIGAPFLYAAERRGILSGPQTRPSRGTIVYPHHSEPRTAVAGPDDAFLRELREREPADTTVCLYYLDWERPEIRRRYEGAGYRVVTHGRRDDPLFLMRLLDELIDHDRLVSNRIGTAIWYGAVLGLGIEVYGPMPGHDEHEAAAAEQRQRRRWPALFEPGGPARDDARRLAELELGAEHVREPDELRRLLRPVPARSREGRALRAGVLAAFHGRRVLHHANAVRTGQGRAYLRRALRGG